MSLLIAIKLNDVAQVQHLLRIIDPTANDNAAIRCAAQLGHTEIVSILLADLRVNPASRHNFPIRWASENGHAEVVKLLLANKRVNPADCENYALRKASKKGHTQIVRLLLKDDRVDPTEKNFDAILWSIHFPKIHTLLLTDHRVNLKEKGSIKVGDYEYVYLDGTIVGVYEGDVSTLRVITTDGLKEAYIKHQYRIGGEKWAQARNMSINTTS